MPHHIRQSLRRFASLSEDPNRRQRRTATGETDFTVGQCFDEPVYGFPTTVTLNGLVKDATRQRASMFLENIPEVFDKELEEDESCFICMEAFSAEDKAVRMPCKLICGYACLKKWFDPYGSSPHNPCPIGRGILFASDSKPTNQLIEQ